MAIRILPPDVAEKIAAGEVIERPVSVAKELIENAIDAGADDIQVEVLQGGRRLIQVVDNGCGIPAAELPLALARHATSKLTSADDLFRVHTLGFRGEALASIGAVARLTITTRAEEEPVGAMIRVEGGSVSGPEPHPRARGTSVRVENLFFNTPARLRFLRADATEAGHVARLVASYTLAYPDRRFGLQTNGRPVLHAPGSGSLFDALVAIYGLDDAEQMLALQAASRERREIEVSGYVGAPALQRANRADILFFVNRRWVQDSALMHAVLEAYRTLLPQRRFPVAVIDIRMPPEEVDVNVHPTKREVRLRNARDVYVTVQRAVRATIMARHPIPVAGDTWPSEPSGPGGRPSPGANQWALTLTRTADQSGAAPYPDAGTRIRPGETPREGSPEAERLPMLRVLGQIAQTYIVAEGPGGLYLIDQHAAHERIRYEELARAAAEGDAPAQELLEPLLLEFTAHQSTLLEGNLDELIPFGFDVEPFGTHTFMVRRVPAALAGDDVAAAIGEIVDPAATDVPASWQERILTTLSCHTAVRAGQVLAHEEMRDLVRQLERAALPHTCPHGRPTIILLSRSQLARQFGRL